MFPIFCCIPPPGDFVELDVEISTEEYDIGVYEDEFSLDVLSHNTIELIVQDESLTVELDDWKDEI